MAWSRLTAKHKLSSHLPWVHGDERHDRLLEQNFHVLKYEPLLARPQCIQYSLVLCGAHRQHSHWNTVELIKAAPGPSLSQALVDLPHSSVVHLVRAVEDIHLATNCPAQILHRLRLASA